MASDAAPVTSEISVGITSNGAPRENGVKKESDTDSTPHETPGDEDAAASSESKQSPAIPTLPPNPNSPDTVKRLDTLPEELFLMILNWITRPTDLKTLCVTNSTLRRLATPKLYRSMNLFIGGPKDKKLTDMLRRTNPGLTQIREIALRLEKFALRPKRTTYSDDSSSEDEIDKDETTIPARQAQITVRFLLAMLPEDQLEVFSWQNWEPFDVENFEFLCQTQKNLRCIEMGPMDKDLDPILEKKPKMFERLDKVTTIDVYPDTTDRLHAAHRLLKSKPDIEQLTVSTGFEYAGEIPADLNDSSTRPGLLTRTLFSHLMPFESCTPYQKLTSLDLDAIELRYCADTWCKFIQFRNLEKLEVRNCAGTEQLWAQISKPHQRPAKLKTLRWMDDQNNEQSSEQPALDAFDNFLESITSLETLHVFVCGMERLPKVSSIVPHKRSLSSLSVHSRHGRTGSIHTYSETDFDLLCRECGELRQLSINFPKTSADSATPTPEWTAFVDSVNGKLRHLRTLNIRRWPSFRELSLASRSRVLPNLRLYEHYLQRLSQHIFDTSDKEAKAGGWGHGHRSTLSVIAWGANGHSKHECQDKYKIKQIPFVRGRKVGAFGESEMMAVQSVWRLVQFVESESDILNHSLYDMHEIHENAGF